MLLFFSHSPLATPHSLLLQHQLLHRSIILVARRNYLIAGLQAFQHFIKVGILAAKLHVYTISCSSIFTNLEDPVAAGLLVKAAFRKQNGLCFITERQSYLQRLSA